jgi:hypothetical protein
VANWSDVGARAAMLPGAALGSQHGAPAWRCRGKVFVQLNPRLRVPGEDEMYTARGDRVMLLADGDERRALVSQDPHTFVVTPHYESTSWIVAWLDTVDVDQLGELVEEAWRTRASGGQRRDATALVRTRRDRTHPRTHGRDGRGAGRLVTGPRCRLPRRSLRDRQRSAGRGRSSQPASPPRS